ncbi:DUF262 domain-containing protein [Granulicella mallensis]|uniref:GmrSD restriction endonucleases N-terminal domain-containing protein n=1 Tax=Granulicella mallensis TaxID=940614 RepID=A0A7W8E9G8_9BACT|nr:DUF262 domain-containing protein [Granulicella mallensis]MBB5063767.1 hypothetical protein [Granulicella mallensis]
MSFQTPITIRTIIGKIADGKYALPSIQREFEWKTVQIEKLFDSVMRGYPINSFLFWEVPPSDSSKFQFYRFLTHYHEKTARHNPPFTTSGDHTFTAVLDGQQRLTSLVIGLTGSYAAKLPNKRRSNPNAYPKEVLHLDLLNQVAVNQDEEMEYAFYFMKPEEAVKNSDEYWISVPELFEAVPTLFQAMEVMQRPEIHGASTERRAHAQKSLACFVQTFSSDAVINYFLEKQPSLHRVLDIFVRTNSGGTRLSYSDLLLSMATASWAGQDARQEILTLVDDLNSINEDLSIDKDFVMKSCLVLGDVDDVKFKVDNFTAANLSKIETEWPHIKTALHLTISLVNLYGFTNRSLLSNNALIPIAYYLKKRGATPSYLTSASDRADRSEILRWLSEALLKRLFGSMGDTILATMRQEITKSDEPLFPKAAIDQRMGELNRSMLFSDADIEALLDYGYSDREAFLILSLITPDSVAGMPVHVDHIFPRSLLTTQKLKREELPEDIARQISDERDSLANLALLDSVMNQEKSGKAFEDWLNLFFGAPDNRKRFLESRFIPDKEHYTAGEILSVWEARESLLLSALKVRLQAPKMSPLVIT